MDGRVVALPLIVPFQVPLNIRNAAGEAMGDNTLKKLGDLQLYPGTFDRLPGYIELKPLTMTQHEWIGWMVLQDIPEEASVSVAELMPEMP